MARTPPAQRGNRVLVIIISVLVLVGLVSSAVVVTGVIGNPLARFAATATATVTPRPTVLPTPTALPTATPIALNANVPHVNAIGVELLDAVTGQELYGLGANDKLAMASTTKIMTALVTLLSVTPLDQPVTVGNEIVGLDQYDTKMGVSQGQIYTVRELLYGLLLPSGDDAALVLAKAIGGSQAAFVARMNTMAAFLGLTATSFINPHGLDDSTLAGANVTSAHDLAILATFAMQNATFRQIVATPTYTVPATATHDALPPLNTTNEFLSNKEHTKAGYDFTSVGTVLGIDGIKTGFTGLAGRCLVVEARFRGHTVILVELKEPYLPDTDATYEQRFVDATNLLKWLEPQYP